MGVGKYPLHDYYERGFQLLLCSHEEWLERCGTLQHKSMQQLVSPPARPSIVRTEGQCRSGTQRLLVAIEAFYPQGFENAHAGCSCVCEPMSSHWNCPSNTHCLCR